MPTGTKDEPTFREYVVWDAPTRWFHWINALAILGLIATGLVILSGGQLGLSPEGKISLKSVHVLFGYVMAVICYGASSGPSLAIPTLAGERSCPAVRASTPL